MTSLSIDNIDPEYVDTLRLNRFSFKEIASRFLGISRSSFHRWRCRTNYVDPLDNSNFNEDELDAAILSYLNLHHERGQRMIIGHLLSSTNIRASRNQIRESIVRVDPFGRTQRSCRRLIRHDYVTLGPHHMWHIDGHHKLIRYGLITHGGVDGCSRAIIYMRLNNNNTALTAFDSYQYGVTEYQMPDRIRGDGGGENVLICEDILRRRGMDRGSFIIGSSKFNTCIERMWRDLRRVVIQFYMDLFSSLERDGMDISSPYHMMALQHLFIPRIQQEIDQFRLNWNAHPMRTRHNRSPNQDVPNMLLIMEL